MFPTIRTNHSFLTILVLALSGLFAPQVLTAPKDVVVIQMNGRLTEGAVIVKVGGVEVERTAIDVNAPFNAKASGSEESLTGSGRDAPSGPGGSVNMYSNLEGFISGDTVTLFGEVTKSTSDLVGTPISIEADLITNRVTLTYKVVGGAPVEVFLEFIAHDAHITSVGR